jgi:AraC-like DNA-binding protein
VSKLTETSLLIGSSWPAFYQRLFVGAASYQELGNRLIREIKTAHAFRQVDRVRELARILIGIPIKEFQLIGQYYLVWCKCRELEYHPAVLERIAEQTQTYKTQALMSRGTFEMAKGNPEPALYFYTEGLKSFPHISDYIELTRTIAVLKAEEGFHRSALKDLENLAPIIKHAEPRLYYDYLNSYAVELLTADRLYESEAMSRITVSSPFGRFYPEWQETFSEVAAKRKSRSTVAISRPQFEEDEEDESDSENIIRKARIQVVIDYMNANLGKKITLGELARVIGLSPSSPGYFINMFKAETGIPPGEYLMRLRIEKAAHLLATTFLSVKEITIQTGFGYLSRGFQGYFRRYYGMTPIEYRRHAMASQQKKEPAKVLQFPTRKREYDEDTPRKLLGGALKMVLEDAITDKQIERVSAIYYGTLKNLNIWHVKA